MSERPLPKRRNPLALGLSALAAIFSSGAAGKSFTPKSRSYYIPSDRRKRQPSRMFGRPAVMQYDAGGRAVNPKRRAKHEWMSANNAGGRQWVKHRKAVRRAERET